MVKISDLPAIYYDEATWKLVKSIKVNKLCRTILSGEETEIPTDDDL